MRRGLLYTERNARKVRIFALMYGIKRVVSTMARGWRMCLSGCGSGEPQYVQVVWEELVARDKDVTGSCLAIAGTRFPCFTLGG